MMVTSRTLLLAAGLFAMPLVGAMAQSSPAGNYGTSGSAPMGQSTTTPGGTGHTVVPGSNSTQAGTGTGTSEARTNQAVTGMGGGATGGSADGGSGSGK